MTRRASIAAFIACAFPLMLFGCAGSRVAERALTPPADDPWVEIAIETPSAPQGSFLLEIPEASTAEWDTQPVSLRAPAGVVNLARDKPASSNKPEPIIGWPGYVTDGEKDPDDQNVFIPAGVRPWAQVDLEQAARIYGIVVWHWYSGYGPIYRDVVVQIADDEAFTRNVRTIFNNDHDNSSGFGAGSDLEYFAAYTGKRLQLRGDVARYVRIHTNGSHNGGDTLLLEIEVFAMPVANKWSVPSR